MPATSLAQFKFMEAVQHGYIHKKGLSPQKAKEFTEGVHPSKLPEHVKTKKKDKFNKLSSYMK